MQVSLNITNAMPQGAKTYSSTTIFVTVKNAKYFFLNPKTQG